MQITRKRIIYTLVTTMIVVFSTTFAILMTLERMDYRNYLQGEYSKNMYELITSVENIRTNLSKAAVTNSRDQKIIAFEEIFRHTAIANDKLHSLPIGQEYIEGTSKFLSQVGDFCYSLVRASSEGKDLTDEEYASIDRLKEASFGLQNDLNGVLGEINQGKVKWGEIRKKASGVFAKDNQSGLTEKFQGIQKQVAQYPALIYDGPFSDNMLEIKPKIESLKDVSLNEAMEVASNLIGKDKIEKIENKENGSKAGMESYRFEVSIKGRESKDSKVACEITKKGGKVLYLLDGRSVNNATMEMPNAIEAGSKYLDKLGYKNMISTYTLRYDNTALICYVYKQNDIIIYPDQIKVKIALDDGSVIGVESEKYLVAHDDNRKIETPKVTEAQAREKVSKRLNVDSVRLAVVPTETNKEVLCYEFSGNYKEESFIVYINALTGYEQRIIQIINTPNGQLTM